MTATTGSATESATLAEASGLSVQEVEAKLADGFLFYRQPDYFGGEQPPGEWLDTSGTDVVIFGVGSGGFSGVYGRGADLTEAKRNFRKYGGALSKGYTVAEFGPGSALAGVGGGGYRWVGQPPTLTEVAARGKR